jgi:single-stranded-DNA-specific exonuclease
MQVTDGSATVEAIGFELAAPAELLMFTDAPVDLAVVPEADRLDPERIRLRVEALEVPGMDPEAILADTGALVDRLFRHAPDYLGDPRYDGVEDAPGLYTKIVGVTFDGRQGAVAALRAGDCLRLLREPSNAHDPHAIRVATHDGQMLGYLRAQLAGRLSPSIDAGARYRATVTAVTGGGDRSLGVNILLERDDDAGAGALSSHVRGDPRAAQPGAGRASMLLPDRLSGGRPWSPPVAGALAAIAEGKSVALGLPPGRDRAAALAGAAALGARDGRCALIVVPRRREVLHRVDQLSSRLAPLRLRVAGVHGMQGLRERQRVEAALRGGVADVVVASAEAIAEGWMAPYGDRIGIVLLDGASLREILPPGLAGSGQVVVVGNSHEAVAAQHACPDAQVIVDASVRTGIRLRDRRGIGDVHAPLEEVLSRDEKAVVYTAGREHCVQLALWLRERRGADMPRVAYVHGGLPARVRQIIAQAFGESRLGILVATPALDEEALPTDVDQVVMASLPPDRERYAEALGNLGFDRHPVAVTVLFGPREVEARRRALNERAPERGLLAAIYRVLHKEYGERPISWPDDSTWAKLSVTLPGLVRSSVDASLTVFEEAGLAAREVVDGRSEVQLLSTPRRDLGISWRHREGRRERDAFEDVARWAFQASGIELLRAAAGDGGGPIGAVPP